MLATTSFDVRQSHRVICSQRRKAPAHEADPAKIAHAQKRKDVYQDLHEWNGLADEKEIERKEIEGKTADKKQAKTASLLLHK